MITAISCAAQQVLFNLHTIVMQDLAQNSDFLKKNSFHFIYFMGRERTITTEVITSESNEQLFLVSAFQISFFSMSGNVSEISPAYNSPSCCCLIVSSARFKEATNTAFFSFIA